MYCEKETDIVIKKYTLLRWEHRDLVLIQKFQKQGSSTKYKQGEMDHLKIGWEFIDII